MAMRMMVLVMMIIIDDVILNDVDVVGKSTYTILDGTNDRAINHPLVNP